MEKTTEDIIKSLVQHPEPLIRWKIARKFVSYAPSSLGLKNIEARFGLFTHSQAIVA